MDSRISSIWVRMLMSSIRASPPVGVIRPTSMLIVVVLPAPLCPRSAVIWPLGKVADTPPTACTGGPPLDSKVFVRRLRTTPLPSGE